MTPALVWGQALQHSVGELVQAHVHAVTQYGAFLAFDVEADSGAVSTVYGLMHKTSAGPGGVQALLVRTLHPAATPQHLPPPANASHMHF